MRQDSLRTAHFYPDAVGPFFSGKRLRVVVTPDIKHLEFNAVSIALPVFVRGWEIPENTPLNVDAFGPYPDGFYNGETSVPVDLDV